MDTTKNSISPKAMLSSVAGLMFFAPFIKNSINKDPSFSQEEKDFIMGYVQVGFINLAFLAIVLGAALVNMFLVWPYLGWIINIGSIVIFIISIFSIITCANSLSMWKSDEKIVYNVQHKGQILKSYTPILNYVIRFHQNDYSMPYWWLKESILLRTCFIFGTLLFGNYFGMGILVLILVRIILLLINVDIIPLSMKKAINNSFSCNPGEIFAYIFAPIVSKLKKSDYETVLQSRKSQYAQGQRFGISTILQYLMFLGILYLIYRYRITLSLNEIILYIAAALWIIRAIIFSINKKTILKIPVLSEIVSLIFKS